MGLQYFGRENGRGDNAKERQGPDHSGLCKGREFGIYFMSSIKLWNGFILLRDMSWCVCMLSHFSHIWLFAAPWTVALPGFSVHGIIQARILEWLPFPSLGDLPDPGIKSGSPALQADSFTLKPPGKPGMMWHIFLDDCSELVFGEWVLVGEVGDRMFRNCWGSHGKRGEMVIAWNEGISGNENTWTDLQYGLMMRRFPVNQIWKMKEYKQCLRGDISSWGWNDWS